MIIWLEKQFVLAIHSRQLAEHGGSEGVRDNGLLESALARPQQLYAAACQPLGKGRQSTPPVGQEHRVAGDRLPRVRIPLADDEASMRFFRSQTMEALGCRTMTARDGAECFLAKPCTAET